MQDGEKVWLWKFNQFLAWIFRWFSTLHPHSSHFKVQLFWENLRNLPHGFDVYLRSRFLWPSQKRWTLHLSFMSQIQIRTGIYTAYRTILDNMWNKKANFQYLSWVTSNPKWHLSNIHLLRSRPRYWLLGNRIRAKQRVRLQWSKSQSEFASISKMFSAKTRDDKAKFFLVSNFDSNLTRLKASKFRKQIVLYSFEPKTK